jgi:ATP synthase protein I
MGLLCRERKVMIIRNGSNPIRRILAWQAIAALIIALAAGLLSGIHGALSALFGGLVCIVAGSAYAWVGSLGSDRSAGGALRILLRAEAVKVGLMVGLLYLVFAVYKDVVAIEFIGSFIVSVLIFSAAILIPDQQVQSSK